MSCHCPGVNSNTTFRGTAAVSTHNASSTSGYRKHGRQLVYFSVGGIQMENENVCENCIYSVDYGESVVYICCERSRKKEGMRN